MRAGNVYCWGRNDDGGLGSGSLGPTATMTPTQVGAATDWQLIAANGGSSCGIRSGALYCWGNNEYAQLGLPTPWSPTPLSLQ